MALSGQKTVTTAGTAVALGAQAIRGPLAIKAFPTNTGLVYVGNSGNNDVDSNTGYHLSKNEEVVLKSVTNLSDVWVDVAVNGEGVAWLDLGF